MRNSGWVVLFAVMSVALICLESSAGYVWVGVVISWLVAKSISPTLRWLWLGLIGWIIGVVLHLPLTITTGVVLGGWWLWRSTRTWLPGQTLRTLIWSSLVTGVWLLASQVVIRPVVLGALVLSLVGNVSLLAWWWRRKP